MRDFIIKYFGRILAILGCSTVVTACYGSPPGYFLGEPLPRLDFNDNVNGRVLDAETGQPISGIEVKVVPSNCLPDSESSKKFSPVHTSYCGHFEVVIAEEDTYSSYTVECNDVDGYANGSYNPVTEEVSSKVLEKEIVIEMTPRRRVL